MNLTYQKLTQDEFDRGLPIYIRKRDSLEMYATIFSRKEIQFLISLKIETPSIFTFHGIYSIMYSWSFRANLVNLDKISFH